MAVAEDRSTLPDRSGPSSRPPGAGEPRAGTVDLTVLIPALDEGRNLAILLPQLNAILQRLHLRYELFLLTRNADDLTQESARRQGARVIEQQEPGYGGALITGFAAASGEYLLTMDADLSHPPEFVEELWKHRHEADVTIASRYVPGGRADMGFAR